MTERVRLALNGPTGMARRLSREDRVLLRQTRFVVQDSPTDREMALVAEMRPGDHLLGLYTQGQPDEPQPTIRLFASEIEAAGYQPEWVLWHEWGHRADYNHYRDHPTTQAVALLDQDRHSRREQLPRAVRAHVHEQADGDEPCPACELDTHLAVVTMGLDALQQRAHLRHRIPDGLGGRVVEFRERLRQAHVWCAKLSAATPGHDLEAGRIDVLISQVETQIQGQDVSPTQLSRAHPIAYQAYDASVDLGHLYWLARSGS